MRGLLAGLLLLSTAGFTAQAQAGVALGATRVIYPAGQKQAQLAVTNNDDSTYLIQSWVENADGAKDGSFVITPPLFAMQGKKENTLRILDATNGRLPQDRETLFWMNVKAIPSMDKSKLSENTLQLAIISRIKLYYRPAKLALPPDQAAEKLKFRRSGSSLTLINPNPLLPDGHRAQRRNPGAEKCAGPADGRSQRQFTVRCRSRDYIPDD